ncbi:hypothetical protein ANCCAN_27386 [Ancylostoma caninum]|uniref:Uncharacterized protein n=1 Tax=Ancylostoma caninum TaxID=29170 RepID=A0A368F459_ANCCA|nr:hypothetical protein ANCCAN_27386 [Ancylostoma caninum]
MDSFCVVSDQSTICFCPDSCNNHAASMTNAMEHSRGREYGVAYHRYYKNFVPVSEARTSQILSCLINEFKSGTIQSAGAAGPLIMLLVAHCIFTSMEKKRRQEEAELGPEEPEEGGEGAPLEGEQVSFFVAASTQRDESGFHGKARP